MSNNPTENSCEKNGSLAFDTLLNSFARDFTPLSDDNENVKNATGRYEGMYTKAEDVIQRGCEKSLYIIFSNLWRKAP